MDVQYLVAMLVCMTAFASFINQRFIRLPKSIGLTVVTLGVSLIVMSLLSIGQHWVEPIRAFLGGVSFNTTIMNGMLSYLLFANALNINALDLSAHRKIVATLATASVFISCVLVGYLIYYFTALCGYPIPLPYCLLFGALIAPTDPICVIDAMKRTRAPSDIRMKITGEALFNDAASIVLFVVILQYLSGRAMDLNYFQIAGLLLQQGLGGILLGYVLGWITAYFMQMIQNEETPILMSLALVTGGYSIATFLDVSGPICMVVAGLVVGSHTRKSQFSDDRSLRLHNFWGLIDDVLNSFLFALIGLQILSIKTRFSEIILGLTVFVIVILVRGISVGGPLLILEPLRKFNWRVLTIMTWGGMRGGLSIALALSIPASTEKDILVGITYSVVVFSIIFQGLSIQPVIRRLLPSKREKREAEF